MAFVKICGISSMEDVEIVNECKPDYVGFVFAESRRQVPPSLGALLSKNIEPYIKKVGVFVDCRVDIMKEIIDICSLDVVQLHGSESIHVCSELWHSNRDIQIWKTIKMRNDIDTDIDYMERYSHHVHMFLLDTYDPKLQGGGGRPFDWEIVKGLSSKFNIILAGGLNLDNVCTAMDIVNPMGVDVSSGVELQGKKDREKVFQFVRKVREYEKL